MSQFDPEPTLTAAKLRCMTATRLFIPAEPLGREIVGIIENVVIITVALGHTYLGSQIAVMLAILRRNCMSRVRGLV
jgi:hypothetical protein